MLVACFVCHVCDLILVDVLVSRSWHLSSCLAKSFVISVEMAATCSPSTIASLLTPTIRQQPKWIDCCIAVLGVLWTTVESHARATWRSDRQWGTVGHVDVNQQSNLKTNGRREEKGPRYGPSRDMVEARVRMTRAGRSAIGLPIPGSHMLVAFRNDVYEDSSTVV